jgi:hypothetical protein
MLPPGKRCRHSFARLRMASPRCSAVGPVTASVPGYRETMISQPLKALLAVGGKGSPEGSCSNCSQNSSSPEGCIDRAVC